MQSSLFLSVCQTVSNFAQKLPNGFAWNFQGRLAMGQPINRQLLMIKFWWRIGSRIPIRIWIRIPIATLVRRALAEVCTVPELLVLLHLNFRLAEYNDCTFGITLTVNENIIGIGNIKCRGLTLATCESKQLYIHIHTYILIYIAPKS